MEISEQRIAFVGTGQMATAMSAGFVRSLLKPGQIAGYDPFPAAREQFLKATGSGAVVSDSPETVLAGATVIVLAVKPQVMSTALQQVAASMTGSPLVVSVAAGITVSRLASGLPEGTRIIRVMPNTPCLIGKGASGLTAAATATPADVQLVVQLLSTIGIVETVSESLLDAVTGLSGSGPAYVFQMIEALSDGGVKMGLPRATATRLAAQTLLGSAEMLLSTGQHPGVLKDGVTSPGGTTIAGLHAMETGGVRAALMNAVEAATLRSRQLGQS